ncbi:unnamed protein product [Leptidea sinapis]|uniref:Uncharacterized protein n=1 Tax=Leptidea sinapis TaxID=189913 RepID=A0A5E4QC39_9NEOP|nr:unnamed protein product [Leptidea sinapis]
MSDVSSRQKQRRLPRRQRSICQVHYNLRPQSQEVITKPLPLPFASTSMELQKYGMQVAGHKAGVSGARYTAGPQRQSKAGSRFLQQGVLIRGSRPGGIEEVCAQVLRL